MRVDYLISEYNKKMKLKRVQSDEEKLKTLSSILTPTYVNFEQKVDFVKSILAQVISIKDGKIKYCTCEKYHLFICEFLHKWLDLDMDTNSYDEICMNNLLNYLVAIVEQEYETCNSIMDMYLSDLEYGRIELCQIQNH